MPLKGFLMLLLHQTFNEFSIFLYSVSGYRVEIDVVFYKREGWTPFPCWIIDYGFPSPSLSMQSFTNVFQWFQNYGFGKFLRSIDFLIRLKWSKSKEFTGSPLSKVLIMLIQSYFIWATCSKILIVGFCDVDSKACFVCWWNFRDAGCVKPLLQARHLIYTKLEEWKHEKDKQALHTKCQAPERFLLVVVLLVELQGTCLSESLLARKTFKTFLSIAIVQLLVRLQAWCLRECFLTGGANEGLLPRVNS